MSRGLFLAVAAVAVASARGATPAGNAATAWAKFKTVAAAHDGSCLRVTTPSRGDVLLGLLLNAAHRPAHFAPLTLADTLRTHDWYGAPDDGASVTGDAAPPMAALGAAYARIPGPVLRNVTTILQSSTPEAPAYSTSLQMVEVGDESEGLLVGPVDGSSAKASRWMPHYADWDSWRPWAEGYMAWTPAEVAAKLRAPNARHTVDSSGVWHFEGAAPGSPPAPADRPWQRTVLPNGVPEYFSKAWVNASFGAAMPDDLAHLIQARARARTRGRRCRRRRRHAARARARARARPHRTPSLSPRDPTCGLCPTRPTAPPP